MSNGDIAVILRGDASQLAAEIKNAGVVVNDFGRNASASLAKTEAQTIAAAKSFGTLGGALSALASAGAAMAIVRMADAVTTLQTQLRLSTVGAQAATQAYSALFDIAQKSRVSFAELGATFASVSRAGQELGIGQARLLTVTQAISQSMTIGGGSATAMKAALVQLGQGLSSGTLRGEELNSVMEQTPRLAKAIADGLGVPIGELRKLGETGQLTAQQVIAALEKSAPQLAKEMESATLTVGQAFTMLSNSALRFVGDADKASGASATLASALKGVSEAIDSVGAFIRANETAFAVIVGGLAGAATIAGLLALKVAVVAVTGAVAALGVVLMANPILLTIGAIVAAGVALKGVADSAAASEKGLGFSIAALDERIARSEATRESQTDAGIKRLALMRAERVRLQGELAVLTSSSLDTRAEDARLQAGVASFKATEQVAKDLQSVQQMLSGVDKDFQTHLKQLKAGWDAGLITQAQYVESVKALIEKEGGIRKPKAKEELKDAWSVDVARSYTSAMHELGKVQGDAAAKADALSKTQEKLRDVMAAPEWRSYSRQQREQIGYSAALAQAEEDRAAATKLTSEAVKAAAKDHDKYIADLIKSADTVGAHVQKLKDEEAALAMSEAKHISLAQAIELLEIARLQEKQSVAMSYGDEAAVAALQTEIDKRRELLELIQRKATREADATLGGVPKTLKDLADYLDPARAETFGDALTKAFAGANSSVRGLVNAFEAYEKKQLDHAQMQKALANNKDLSPDARIKAEIKLTQERADIQIEAYANMAGATKKFFNENSAGYRLLSGIEKGLHLVRMAQMAERLYSSIFLTTTQVVGNATVAASGVASDAVQIPGAVALAGAKAVGAVANQGNGDPYTAFPRIAAMIAIMAGLGLMVGGGSSAPVVTMDDFAKQKANDGSGTVFGDKNAQSESIANSLAALEALARPELSFTSQMVGLLRDINNTLAGTTNAILSSGFDLSGGDFQGSQEAGGDWFFGKSSSKTTLSGLGLAFGKQTVAEAMKAIEVQRYQETKTDWSESGFLGFGSESGTDYKSSFASLDTKVADSMSRVIQQMAATVGTVGTKLGATPAQLAAAQNIDSGLGKVSLLNKSFDDVQALLSSVFSAMGDKMAEIVAPGLDDFKKGGQGYLETLIAVAAGMDQAALFTDKLGISMVTIGDLNNKQGDIGAELVRQSITNAEALHGTVGAVSSIGTIIHNFTGTAADIADMYSALVGVRTAMLAMGFTAATVSVDLLRGAGGLDALKTGIADFQDNFLTQAERLAVQQATMDAAFAKLGMQTPKTAAEFKSLVYSLKDGGEASQELLGRVLVLSGGFADLVSEMDKANTALTTIKTTLKGLEGDRAAALAVADSALQGVKDAITSAKTAAQTTYDNTIGALAKQELALTTAYEFAVKAQNDIKEAASTARKLASDALDTERKAAAAAYKAATGAITDERKLAVTAFKSASDTIKASIDAANSSIGLLRGLDGSLANAMRWFKQQDTSIASRQAGQADLAAALAQAQAGNFPTAESIADAIAAVTQPSEQFFSSFADYQRDYFKTAITISDLGKLTNVQLSTEEQALQVLTNSQSLMQTQHDEHMARLDAAKETLDANYEALQALFDQRAESIAGRFESTTTTADEELKRLKEKYDLDIKGLNEDRKAAKGTLDDVIGKLDAQLGLAQKEYDAVMGLAKPLTDIATALAALNIALGNFKVADKAVDIAKVAYGNPNISSTDIKAFVDQALAKSTDGTGADAAALLYQYAVANGLSTNQIAGSGANPVLTQANLNNYTATNNLPGLDTLLTANGTDATNLANTATVKAADLVAATSGVARVKDFLATLAGHEFWQRELYDFATGAHIISADVDAALGAAPGTVNSWAVANGLPAFALGTNFVPRDMVAQIHQGEAIIPAAFNPERYSRASGNEALVVELKALRAEVEELRKEQRAGQAQIASNTGKTVRLLDIQNADGIPVYTP